MLRWQRDRCLMKSYMHAVRAYSSLIALSADLGDHGVSCEKHLLRMLHLQGQRGAEGVLTLDSCQGYINICTCRQ